MLFCLWALAICRPETPPPEQWFWGENVSPVVLQRRGNIVFDFFFAAPFTSQNDERSVVISHV